MTIVWLYRFIFGRFGEKHLGQLAAAILIFDHLLSNKWLFVYFHCNLNVTDDEVVYNFSPYIYTDDRRKALVQNELV